MLNTIRKEIFQDYPLRSIAIWFLFVGLGLFVIASAALSPQLRIPDFGNLVLLAALLVASNAYPVKAPGGKIAITSGDFAIFISFLSYGTEFAVLAAALASLASALTSSKRLTSHIFSPAVSAISMLVAGSVALYVSEHIALQFANWHSSTLLTVLALAVVFSFIECYTVLTLAFSKSKKFVSLKALADVWMWALVVQLMFAVLAALTFSTFDITAAIISGTVIFLVTQLVRVSFIRQEREKKAHEDENRRAEEEIRYLAFHDQTTKLKNRTAFNRDIEEAITLLRSDNRGFAVVFIDLDRFKVVNDGLGHAVGDEVLRRVGDKIQSSVRAEDTSYRVGGDEFCVLVRSSQLDVAVDVANRLATAIAIPIVVNDTQMTITASIGVRIASPADTSAQQVLIEADNAMYTAKQDGRAKVRIFEPERHLQHARKVQIEYQLKKSIVDDSLQPVFQPIIDIESGEIESYELLLRTPFSTAYEAVIIAEQSTLIDDLTLWATKKAIDFLRNRHGSFSVHVNLSPRNLEREVFTEQLCKVVQMAPVNPKRLVFEITESSTMFDTETTLQRLNKIVKTGAQIAIDDFGIGFSSLSYLSELPFDQLKIDASFTRGAMTNKNTAEVVKLVVALARVFGKPVVAEGVETLEHVKFLKEAGVSFGQGYFFSRPVEEKEAANLLTKHFQVDK